MPEFCQAPCRKPLWDVPFHPFGAGAGTGVGTATAKAAANAHAVAQGEAVAQGDAQGPALAAPVADFGHRPSSMASITE